MNQLQKILRNNIPLRQQWFKEFKSKEIGENVWNRTRVIILPHVTKIGPGVIIGSGAVVTKDIPNNAIVVGNPTKVIRYR